MDCALEVKGLRKQYSNFTLENFNLTLPKGSILGLIGENGAGKSTAFKTILGLAYKDAGSVKFFGTDFKPEDKELKEKIGVVFDGNPFQELLTNYSVTSLSVGLLFISLYVPALIKVGVEKARVLVLVLFVGITALGFIAFNNRQKAPNWFIQFGENIGRVLDRNVFLMLLFMLVLLAISLLFSVHWMEKKEI